MSLLMEALRKAEEAKRRTSEQYTTEASSSTRLPESPYALSRRNELPAEEHEQSRQAFLSGSASRKTQPASTSEELSTLTPASAEGDAPAEPSATQAGSSNTTAGSPQNPPIPAQSPTTTAAHTLDQRSASALFLAKQRAQRRQQQRQRVAFLLCLLLLLPVAGGLFYWWQIQIASTTGITASLPRTIGASWQLANSARTLDNPVTTVSAESTATNESPAADGSSAMLPTSELAQVTQLDSSTTPDANPALSVTVENTATDNEAESSRAGTNGSEVETSGSPAEGAQPANVSGNSDRILSLVHRDSTLVVSPELSSAYEHFLNGNLPAATADYLLLLEEDPGNRQAMLGLATIYRRRGDIAAAQGLYARLLEMNPRDPLARTGLINAASSADPLQRASDLRQLQEDYPSLAPITFALGNLHASQGRWREAQSAYFDALRKARSSGDGPISPDYAFNLAISLERLGEPALAYDYYQQAERLAQVVAPSFDRETLQQRLQALQ